ncbi:N-6 DNA methylase [Peptostreptococcus porci]|uniref:N-6 DNA methylase n=1 Tax=Peptostreptococcus porci TaxID=2652282 RepID=UPI002A91A39C|nr:N-6 DNA methylase [Peptostreptococcus porci]MDY5437155.1 N-6 DNA methylase [Peptostreptococcus porci]
MINADILYKLFDCKEGFELPDKIIDLYKNDKQKLENIASELSQKIDESDKDNDLFLEYFQSEHSERKSLKQDYTPNEISKLIYKLIKRDGKISILDFCAGTGSLSIPWLIDGKDRTIEFREYSKRSIAFLLLNLLIRNVNAVIKQMDVLTDECFQILEIGIVSKTDYKFDVVISNPPYSQKWNPVSLINELKPPPKSKADYAFVIKGLESLKEDGTMVMVLPHGVLFRGQTEGEIRKYLLRENYIDAIIGLPEHMFQNTGIPVCLVIFRKNRSEKNVLFIDASKEFIKVNKFNKLEEKHIEKIVSVYKNRLEVEKYSHIATYEEIEKNEFNLSIPRYVDTFEHEECDPLDVAVSDLLATQIDIVKTQDKLISMMKELVGDSDEVQCELNRAVETLEDYQKLGVSMVEGIVRGFGKD